MWPASWVGMLRGWVGRESLRTVHTRWVIIFGLYYSSRCGEKILRHVFYISLFRLLLSSFLYFFSESRVAAAHCCLYYTSQGFNEHSTLLLLYLTSKHDVTTERIRSLIATITTTTTTVYTGLKITQDNILA